MIEATSSFSRSRFAAAAVLFLTSVVGGCTSGAGDPVAGTGGAGAPGMSTSGGAPGTGGARATSTGGAGQAGGSGGALVASTGGSAQTSSGGASSTGGSVATGGASATGGGSAAGGGASSTGGAGATGGRPGGPADAGSDSGTVPGTDANTDANQGTLPAITLHLAGDSTVMSYAVPLPTVDEGWGQELGQFFISKVAINNQSLGGQSSVSFYGSSRWTNITSSIKPGDFVMAAFGANDSSAGSTRFVEPAVFQATFLKMADEVKAKQGIFIPVTPSALREFTGVREGNQRLGPYAAATIAAGAMRNLPVDDLNARSVELLNMIGPTGAALLYKGTDKAHFTKAGAIAMAKIVAEELRRIGSPLAAYLK